MTASMDRQYIDDNQIIERYLTGGLSPDDTENFELYILEHDDVLQELECARALRAGLRDAFAEESTHSARKKSFLADRFRHLGLPLRIAAGFVLAVGLATSGVLFLRDGKDAGTAYESMVIELTAVRGGGSGEPVDRIVLSDDTPRMLRFPIPLQGAEAERVEVSLTSLDEPGPPLDRAELATGNADRVVYSVLSSELPAGRYALHVQTETGFLLASYSFRLTRTD